MICWHNTSFVNPNWFVNITLARNKAPWWWSDKIETCRSVLKYFMWNYMCIHWLINWSDTPACLWYKKIWEDGQCAYNVKLRWCFVIIIAIENNKYFIFICVCSFSYAACNAHRPYCHVTCQASQYLTHCLINSTIFEKKKKKSYWSQNVCFDFRYNICLEHFRIVRKIERDISEMYIGLNVT